jgi:hypothetical protein
MPFFAAIHNVLHLMENNNSNNQKYYNNCNKTNHFNNAWSRAYVAAVQVPLDDPFAPAACHKSSPWSNFNTLTNLSHCLDLIISSCKVMRARSKTAMAHARLPCVFIALLLVSHDTANEQARQTCKSICPSKEDCVFGPLRPSVEKFDPTLVVQANLSSRGGLISSSRTSIPRFVIHWQPPNRNPIVGLSAFFLVQIQQTHCTRKEIMSIIAITTIMVYNLNN